MAAVIPATYDERDLVTITVKRRFWYRPVQAIGVVFVRFGCWLSGVGELIVDDGEGDEE